MAIVVQKYGGTSVASVEKMKAVAAKVVATKKAGHDVVVVVSAMGKSTDELLSLAHEMDASPPRRELDMLLSAGERISMALLSMAIQKLGVEAISFTGSQSGIITNDRHYDARIIEVRPFRIEDELARGRVVIIAGFQGMSYKREITTLGRSGSDTTALAMAAALGADRVEIYSDVDGVYSADPRIASDAQHLPEIGYDEMAEMAFAGASVIHSKAVAFAQKANIAIHARSTFGDGERETVVRQITAGDEARAVVGSKGLALATLPLTASQALSAATEFGVGVAHCDHEGERLRLLLESDAPNWAELKAAFEAQGASITEDLGMVSVVGGAPAAIAAATLQSLSDHDQTPILFFTTPLRVSAVLPVEHTDAAVRQLHAALV